MSLHPQHVRQGGQRRRRGVQDDLALRPQDGLLGVEEDGVGDDVDHQAPLVDLVPGRPVEAGRLEGGVDLVARGGIWPSNWELSAFRATTVVRYLAKDGVPETRMSADGYSSTEPLVPESDPTAITVNRRVDIVVLSTASAEANALLPGIDAAHRGVTE